MAVLLHTVITVRGNIKVYKGMKSVKFSLEKFDRAEEKIIIRIRSCNSKLQYSWEDIPGIILYPGPIACHYYEFSGLSFEIRI